MDGYSRMVQLLKVLLPLAALALLSTLFLLSRSVDPNATIPFAEQDMADRMRDQQVTKPYFSGTTAKGEEVLVTAMIARPGGPNSPAEATDLDAQIKLIDGQIIRLTSDLGSVALDRDMAVFSGDVRITSTDGTEIRTEVLNTALSGIKGSTPGTVTGTGPIGDFTAGNMEMGAKNDDGPIHMVFKNGVKLIYDPQKQER